MLELKKQSVRVKSERKSLLKSLAISYLLCEKCDVFKRQIKEENIVSKMCVGDTKEQRVS